MQPPGAPPGSQSAFFGGFRRTGTSQMAVMVSRRRKPDPGIRRSSDGSFLFCNRAAYEVRGRASTIGRPADSHYSDWFFDRAGSRDHSPTSRSIAHHLSCRASGLAVHDLANPCCRLRKTSHQVTSPCGDPSRHRTCSAAPAAAPHNQARLQSSRRVDQSENGNPA